MNNAQKRENSDFLDKLAEKYTKKEKVNSSKNKTIKNKTKYDEDDDYEDKDSDNTETVHKQRSKNNKRLIKKSVKGKHGVKRLS